MGQTSDQVRQLAELYSEMSSTVDDYRSRRFEELAPAERLGLEQLFQQLCDVHDRFTALAIQNTLDAIAFDLDKVMTVTATAQQSLSHLHTMAEITKLVSATAQLGVDICLADYGAIPRAIKDVVQALPRRIDHQSDQ